MAHSLTFERWFPLTTSIALAAVLAVLDRQFGIVIFKPDLDLSTALISLGGIFAGFIAAVQTLLVGMTEKVKITLVNSGYMDDLQRYLSEALWSSITLCLLNVATFSDLLKENFTFLIYLQIASLAYALLTLHRAGKITTLLLRAK